MILNQNNYFSEEATRAFWSVSQFKAFDKCEAAGLAEVTGEYERETTDALLIGSYVDAHLAGEADKYFEEHKDQMFSKRGGGLLAKFKQADEIIETVRSQPLMMEYLEGDKQVIRTAELWGIPWKIKMDVFNGERIVDLKVVKDFGDIYQEGFGRRSWIEYWGYDIQGAIYQKVEQISSGRADPLPFYIVAVTKEKVPDVAVIQIPQDALNTAYKLVEAKIERFDFIKTGDVEPIRCEKCDYCRRTKILYRPTIFSIKEAGDGEAD